MTDDQPAEIRLDGINGEVLRATVWTTSDGSYFQFEVYLDADDETPVSSIEITPGDAMRLAMGLAGTALTKPHPAPTRGDKP